MAPIYFGSKKVNILGISKAYKGNTLVYQKVPPVPPTPSDDYFTLINRSDDTRAIQIIFGGDASGLLGWPELLYSYDGTNWQEYSIDRQTKQGQELSVNAGYYVQFRNLNQYFSYNPSFYTSNYFYIKCVRERAGYQDWEVSGNILSLINYQQMQKGGFYELFRELRSLYKADNLILPDYVTENCYGDMFYGCTSLTAAPELPAITLAPYCYSQMFDECTSLTTVPKLPATTLDSYCYAYMFNDCTSLNSIPELPTTTLAAWSYYKMFSGCTKIKISETQGGIYTNTYRIPPTGTASGTLSAVDYMFEGTGGSFTGSPSINTTYYTSNTII